MLALAVAAVLAGAGSFAAIGEWAGDLPAGALSRLGVHTPPEESTLRTLFARVDADALERQVGAFVWTRTGRSGGRRVIAVDGKSVRGARTRGPLAPPIPHLVAAFDHDAGGAGTGRGGREEQRDPRDAGPAVRFRAVRFELSEAVVTCDAMNTQTDTAGVITGAGGDYVFTVKKNTPGLHPACKDLPWKQVPAHRVTEFGHGRAATRTIKVLQAPAWVDFPAAGQIRRTVTKAGKRRVEVVYVITSAEHRAAPPATLAAWVQGHWGIENLLHWVRDVTFDEDRSQVRTGHAPRIMASLRSTAITVLRLTNWTCIAAGLRHHSRDPDRPIACLMTC